MLVLEEHHGLAGHSPRQLPMRRLVEHADGNLCPLHQLGSVEHSEPEARGEQSGDRRIDLRLGDQPEFHRFHQIGIHAAAIEVGTALHGERGGGRRGGRDFVAQVDVVDRAAVRHDVSRELPLTTQDVLQQQVAAARRLAADAIVGAHQRIRSPLADAGLEVRQVALAQVALADHRVERVAVGLWSAVHGEMLHRGHRLQVLRVVTLKAANELRAEPAREKGIFTVRFLSPPPPRVAKEIDIGRPEREPLITLVAVGAEVGVILRACLVGNRRRHPEDQRIVPRGTQPDGLRK